MQNIRKVTKLPIICDGGLRHPGDIAKAVRFGSNLCMMGLMFAAFEESPGNVVIVNNVKYKEYYGSASMFNKKTKVHIEGKKELLLFRGSIWSYLNELQQDLQSAISYSGGRKTADIRDVDYIITK